MAPTVIKSPSPPMSSSSDDDAAACRYYHLRASALLNDIGASHHIQDDAAEAMEAYSESIRSREELLARSGERGDGEPPIRAASGGGMEDDLRYLERRDAALEDLTAAAAASSSCCPSEGVVHLEPSRDVIGVHYVSQPLRINPREEGLRDDDDESHPCSVDYSLPVGKPYEDTASTLFNIALLHQSQSDFAGARQVLEIALDLLPSSTNDMSSPSQLSMLKYILCTNLGYAALHGGDFETAIAHYQTASSEASCVAKDKADQNEKDQDLSFAGFALAALLNLSRCCDLAGLHSKAMELCFVAEEVGAALRGGGSDSKLSGDDDDEDAVRLDLSLILYVKACICRNLDENDDHALQLFRCFLRESIQFYGWDHPCVGLTLESISDIVRGGDVLVTSCVKKPATNESDSVL